MVREAKIQWQMIKCSVHKIYFLTPLYLLEGHILQIKGVFSSSDTKKNQTHNDMFHSVDYPLCFYEKRPKQFDFILLTLSILYLVNISK